VNIEEFYDADPRRRSSDEVEFGSEWRDADQIRFGVSWVADTGEVYAMREPMEPIDVIPGFGTEIVEPMDVETVTVEVLATIAERDEVERRLEGWEDRMADENSMAWAREQLTR
jgi:hypothetical protein